jgi:predicted nucleic acid-binding protein
VRIHLDTNLLIQQPNWDALPPGSHELFVSAIVFAEFSEGAAHPDPGLATRAGLDLIRFRDVYGEGLSFGQREADIYRELCAAVSAAGKAAGGRRRVDLMIAAVAVADGAALATRNVSDFTGLESVLEVLHL